ILIIVSFIIYKHIQVKTKQKINELTLQNLIQQMNPHFIFNTLNSIQYYMYNHSELETNEYISKFSQLIRKILENTNNSKVKIMDELEAIKLYIELEQLRFNNSFDYQITLPSDASLDEYKIPTMFIQPFVENAIIHGLRHLKDKGLLSITVSVKNGLLICEIDDNGIGRSKAEEINADNKHKSLSLSIANERLKLLSSSTYTKLKINYYDKSTTPGERGTKVIIELPIFK
ncbi:MAG TPA: histidine kinase, partial [Bacteroidales bacterium]|nr:histidine kinase [Bacteroidales bacterium]